MSISSNGQFINCCFINCPFMQKDILINCHFHRLYISLTNFSSILNMSVIEILLTGYVIGLTVHQLVISSRRHSIYWLLHQLAASSTGSYLPVDEAFRMCGSRECLVSNVFFPLLHVNGPRATICSNLAVREYIALEKAN